MKPAFRRISVFLAAVYFFTNCAFAHMVETSLWEERQRSRINEMPSPRQFFSRGPGSPDSFSALTKYGSIRKILTPKSPSIKSQIIIHIQDIHRNLEAQKNIELALLELQKTKSIETIALEGAFGPINLSRFHGFPDQKSLGMAADYLLRTGEMSGAMRAALFPYDVRVIGIDDERHHAENVKAYLSAVPQQNEIKKMLAADKNRNDSKKAAVFNAALRTFDLEVERSRNNQIRLGEYAGFLAAHCGTVPSHVRDLLRALKMEGQLNFDQFKKDRDAGKYTPAVAAYVDYALFTRKLDIEETLKEIRQMENDGYAALARTAREKKLVAESRWTYLAGKLADFSLTKEEWDEYRLSTKYEVRMTNLAPFENFYEEAETRDERMAFNLIRTSSFVLRTSPLVLVTGGFHSSGIDQRLVDAGYTVVQFTPKISKVDSENGSAYLSVFSQKKTPLASLFEGQKLFLAEVQTNPLAELTLSAAALSETETPAQSLHDLAGATLINLEVERRTPTEVVATAENAGRDPLRFTIQLEGRTMTGFIQEAPGKNFHQWNNQLSILKSTLDEVIKEEGAIERWKSARAAIDDLFVDIKNYFTTPDHGQAVAILAKYAATLFGIAKILDMKKRRRSVREHLARAKTYGKLFLSAYESTVRSLRNIILEDKKSAPPIEPVNATKTIRRIVANHRIQSPAISFSVMAPEGAIQVLANQPEFEEVIENVLLNAVGALNGKKTAKPEINIQLSVENGEAVFRILDNGPGFPESFFLNGWLKKGSTSQVGPGHGIGMEIVKDHVERWSGKATAANQAGGGAEIVIRLPLAPAKEPPLQALSAESLANLNKSVRIYEEKSEGGFVQEPLGFERSRILLTAYRDFMQDFSSIMELEAACVYYFMGADVVPALAMKTFPVNIDGHDAGKGMRYLHELLGNPHNLNEETLERNLLEKKGLHAAKDTALFEPAIESIAGRRIFIFKGMQEFGFELAPDVTRAIMGKLTRPGDMLLILCEKDRRQFQEQARNSGFVELFSRTFPQHTSNEMGVSEYSFSAGQRQLLFPDAVSIWIKETNKAEITAQDKLPRREIDPESWRGEVLVGPRLESLEHFHPMFRSWHDDKSWHQWIGIAMIWGGAIILTGGLLIGIAQLAHFIPADISLALKIVFVFMAVVSIGFNFWLGGYLGHAAYNQGARVLRRHGIEAKLLTRQHQDYDRTILDGHPAWSGYKLRVSREFAGNLEHRSRPKEIKGVMAMLQDKLREDAHQAADDQQLSDVFHRSAMVREAKGIFQIHYAQLRLYFTIDKKRRIISLLALKFRSELEAGYHSTVDPHFLSRLAINSRDENNFFSNGDILPKKVLPALQDASDHKNGESAIPDPIDKNELLLEALDHLSHASSMGEAIAVINELRAVISRGKPAPLHIIFNLISAQSNGKASDLLMHVESNLLQIVKTEFKDDFELMGQLYGQWIESWPQLGTKIKLVFIGWIQDQGRISTQVGNEAYIRFTNGAHLSGTDHKNIFSKSELLQRKHRAAHENGQRVSGDSAVTVPSKIPAPLPAKNKVRQKPRWEWLRPLFKRSKKPIPVRAPPNKPVNPDLKHEFILLMEYILQKNSLPIEGFRRVMKRPTSENIARWDKAFLINVLNRSGIVGTSNMVLQYILLIVEDRRYAPGYLEPHAGIPLPTRRAAERQGWKPFGFWTDTLFSPNYEFILSFLLPAWTVSHFANPIETIYWNSRGHRVNQPSPAIVLWKFSGTLFVWAGMLSGPLWVGLFLSDSMWVIGGVTAWTVCAMTAGILIARIIYEKKHGLTRREKILLYPLAYSLKPLHFIFHAAWNAVIRWATLTAGGTEGKSDAVPQLADLQSRDAAGIKWLELIDFKNAGRYLKQLEHHAARAGISAESLHARVRAADPEDFRNLIRDIHPYKQIVKTLLGQRYMQFDWHIAAYFVALELYKWNQSPVVVNLDPHTDQEDAVTPEHLSSASWGRWQLGEFDMADYVLVSPFYKGNSTKDLRFRYGLFQEYGKGRWLGFDQFWRLLRGRRVLLTFDADAWSLRKPKARGQAQEYHMGSAKNIRAVLRRSKILDAFLSAGVVPDAVVLVNSLRYISPLLSPNPRPWLSMLWRNVIAECEKTWREIGSQKKDSLTLTNTRWWSGFFSLGLSWLFWRHDNLWTDWFASVWESLIHHEQNFAWRHNNGLPTEEQIIGSQNILDAQAKGLKWGGLFGWWWFGFVAHWNYNWAARKERRKGDTNWPALALGDAANEQFKNLTARFNQRFGSLIAGDKLPLDPVYWALFGINMQNQTFALNPDRATLIRHPDVPHILYFVGEAEGDPTRLVICAVNRRVNVNMEMSLFKNVLKGLAADPPGAQRVFASGDRLITARMVSANDPLVIQKLAWIGFTLPAQSKEYVPEFKATSGDFFDEPAKPKKQPLAARIKTPREEAPEEKPKTEPFAPKELLKVSPPVTTLRVDSSGGETLAIRHEDFGHGFLLWRPDMKAPVALSVEADNYYLSPTGDWFVFKTPTGQLQAWDFKSQAEVTLLEPEISEYDDDEGPRSQWVAEVGHFAWSADGRYLAAHYGKTLRIWEADEKTLRGVKTLTDFTGAFEWSPAGHDLVYESLGRLHRYDPNSSGSSIILEQVSLFRPFHWNPSGPRLLASGSNRTLYAIGSPSHLVEEGLTSNPYGWSPKGNWVWFIKVAKAGDKVGDLFIWKHGEKRIIGKASETDGVVGWSADERLIYFLDPALNLAVRDLREPKSSAFPIHETTGWIRINPDGRNAAFLNRNKELLGELLVWRFEGPAPKSLGRSIWTFEWSPDSRTLAYIDKDHNLGFWDRELSEKHENVVESVETLAWRPDGRLLVGKRDGAILQLDMNSFYDQSDVVASVFGRRVISEIIEAVFFQPFMGLSVIVAWIALAQGMTGPPFLAIMVGFLLDALAQPAMRFFFVSAHREKSYQANLAIYRAHGKDLSRLSFREKLGAAHTRMVEDFIRTFLDSFRQALPYFLAIGFVIGGQIITILWVVGITWIVFITEIKIIRRHIRRNDDFRKNGPSMDSLLGEDGLVKVSQIDSKGILRQIKEAKLPHKNIILPVADTSSDSLALIMFAKALVGPIESSSAMLTVAAEKNDAGDLMQQIPGIRVISPSKGKLLQEGKLDVAALRDALRNEGRNSALLLSPEVTNGEEVRNNLGDENIEILLLDGLFPFLKTNWKTALRAALSAMRAA